ncbi:MAG: amidohydrolase family protein [Proteobacteria bacterium]|nr:amidohydrolase family protein [Pseudomonadota bacterium]
MHYDLVVRDGTVVDGSGLASYRADVGIVGGRIAAIGRIRENAERTLDAEGHVVAPGFIDGHTHMDAQICWDPLGTCSCWHGVTSVVMGNCGFTLAPSRRDERHLVVRNLERAEDISADAMAAGIDWQWETFSEYLDTVERLPKGINYAGYVGHSALRTFAMGERAFEEPGTDADQERMERELCDALGAGALGFTTSRTRNHQTSDDRPVASRLADWDEVRRLVCAMGRMGTGIFEIANEDLARVDPEARSEYFGRLTELSIESGRPVTWGIGSSRHTPGAWRPWVNLLDEASDRGARMFAQVHSREFAVVLSFRANLPYDQLPVWKELRRLPLEEQRARLRDPGLLQRLVESANTSDYGRAIGAEARKPDYDWLFPLDSIEGPRRSVAEVARERGADPAQTFLELALESDLERFFLQPFANENLDEVLEIMQHPRTVVTFSDSGAHVSQIMDSSIPTHVLSYWVRERQALHLEEAVRMLSFEPASAWGFADRGLIREGFAADLVVFDPDRVAPAMPEVDTDLPGGARRLKQGATGIRATVVNGEPLLSDGEHTGALPGRLLRGPLAQR